MYDKMELNSSDILVSKLDFNVGMRLFLFPLDHNKSKTLKQDTSYVYECILQERYRKNLISTI